MPGLLTKAADDKSALNELCQRLVNTGAKIDQQTWGVGQEQWLAFLRHRPNALGSPTTLSSLEAERLHTDLRDARAALDAEQAVTRELRYTIERLSKATTSAEVREAVLPREEGERFEVLLSNALRSLRKIPAIVRKAVWFDLAEGSMPWPSAHEGDDESHLIRDAQRDGLLVDHGEYLTLNEEFPSVNEASTEVRRLHDFLRGAESEEFTDWFIHRYAVPQDLTRRLSGGPSVYLSATGRLGLRYEE